MNYAFKFQTHSGQVRSNNEDAGAFDSAVGLAVLADGMGGYNAGEVASAMAVDAIMAEIGQWLRDASAHAQPHEVRQALEIGVDNANLAVSDAANQNPSYAGMGTTLVMAVFRPSEVHVAHVGDSRCYRFRAGELVQLTKDHSYLQLQIDAGLITPEEALVAGNRNLVTRALGVEGVVVPDITQHPVADGDLFLLCSDGLTDMLLDAEIADVLMSGESLDDTANQLIQMANLKGGRDNISVLLVQAGEAAVRKSRLISRILGKYRAS